MASAYATLAASGVYHKPHFVQKVVNSRARCCSTPPRGQQRRTAHRQGSADNVTSAMQPIAGWSNGHNLAGGVRRRPRREPTSWVTPTPTGRVMVGYTPSCRPVVVGWHHRGHEAAREQVGSPVYGSGLPSDIWKSTMDGGLKTRRRVVPKPTEIGGYAGVPQPAAAVRHCAAAAL